MASKEEASTATAVPANIVSTEPTTSSSPVEMTDLQTGAGAERAELPAEQSTPIESTPQPDTETTTTTPPQPAKEEQKAVPTTPIEPVTTNTALGPATDSAVVPVPTNTPTGPTLIITLMLTTGARHPYKIDEKYLSARKVEARSKTDDSFDPREVSGYKLKELIWTDWRSEWEPRPSSPSSIRLIILGKMVDDKKALKEYAFHLDSPNILHMTVKPADFDDDEATAGKSTGKSGSLRQRDGDDGQGAGCRCVIL